MDKTDIKRCKTTLNILQIAATDKENLTSKITVKSDHGNKIKKSDKKLIGKRLKKNSSNEHKKNSQFGPKCIIPKTYNTNLTDSGLESDLIIDNPSEAYWKSLAESRSKALDSALKENIDLHNKVNELEYENERLKAMLDEAKALVEVLTEMIEENGDSDSDNDNNDDSSYDGNGNSQDDSILNETNNSDLCTENMSLESNI